MGLDRTQTDVRKQAAQWIVIDFGLARVRRLFNAVSALDVEPQALTCKRIVTQLALFCIKVPWFRLESDSSESGVLDLMDHSLPESAARRIRTRNESVRVGCELGFTRR